MAQGKHFESGSKRREKIEETRYETADAIALTHELRQLVDEDVLDAGGNDALEAALEALTRVETLVSVSDTNDIDLISYSDVSNSC